MSRSRQRHQPKTAPLIGDPGVRVRRALESTEGTGHWGIAIDTNQIGGPPAQDPGGFRFGPLHELRDLKKDGIEVLITSVWEVETLRHLALTLDERTKALRDAAGPVKDLGIDPFRRLAIGVIKDVALLPGADEVWTSFKAAVGMDVVDVIEADAAQSLRLYQQVQWPFENGKKEEFPDALSLLALNRYANVKDMHIAVVTSDQGCLQFCHSTQRLHGFGNIEAARNALAQKAHVVECLAHAPKMRQWLAAEDSLAKIKDSFGAVVAEVDLDVSAIVAPGQFRLDTIWKRVNITRAQPFPETLVVSGFDSFGIRFECRFIVSGTVTKYAISQSAGGVVMRKLVISPIETDQVVNVFVPYPGQPFTVQAQPIRYSAKFAPLEEHWEAVPS